MPDKLVSWGSVQCWKALCCLLVHPASSVPLCSNLNMSVAYRSFYILHTRGCIAKILAATSGARKSNIAG